MAAAGFAKDQTKSDESKADEQRKESIVVGLFHIARNMAQRFPENAAVEAVTSSFQTAIDHFLKQESFGDKEIVALQEACVALEKSKKEKGLKIPRKRRAFEPMTEPEPEEIHQIFYQACVVVGERKKTVSDLIVLLGYSGRSYTFSTSIMMPYIKKAAEVCGKILQIDFQKDKERFGLLFCETGSVGEEREKASSAVALTVLRELYKKDQAKEPTDATHFLYAIYCDLCNPLLGNTMYKSIWTSPRCLTEMQSHFIALTFKLIMLCIKKSESNERYIKNLNGNILQPIVTLGITEEIKNYAKQMLNSLVFEYLPKEDKERLDGLQILARENYVPAFFELLMLKIGEEERNRRSTFYFLKTKNTREILYLVTAILFLTANEEVAEMLFPDQPIAASYIPVALHAILDVAYSKDGYQQLAQDLLMSYLDFLRAYAITNEKRSTDYFPTERREAEKEIAAMRAALRKQEEKLEPVFDFVSLERDNKDFHYGKEMALGLKNAAGTRDSLSLAALIARRQREESENAARRAAAAAARAGAAAGAVAGMAAAK